MYEYCWPFPKFDEIVKTFPHYAIDERVYKIAKDFYSNSMKAESERLGEFIREKSTSDKARRFILHLVTQAVDVAIGHTKHK